MDETRLALRHFNQLFSYYPLYMYIYVHIYIYIYILYLLYPNPHHFSAVAV